MDAFLLTPKCEPLMCAIEKKKRKRLGDNESHGDHASNAYLLNFSADLLALIVRLWSAL